MNLSVTVDDNDFLGLSLILGAAILMLLETVMREGYGKAHYQPTTPPLLYLTVPSGFFL